MTPAKQPTDFDRLLSAEPDLVDRLFDYILSDPALALAIKQLPSGAADPIGRIKTAVRAEFAGEECYIAGRRVQSADVLALFNGRNATEVARRLNISRATVYRHIKQPGKPAGLGKKPSQFSGK